MDGKHLFFKIMELYVGKNKKRKWSLHKKKFSIKDFFNKRKQIYSFLRI